MQLNEVIETQIDTVIAGLVRTRAKLAGQADIREDFHEIDHQLETVAFHIQDIQNNWLSLMQHHQA